MDKYLEAGKIVNTHGVRGAVRIESYCDSPEALASIKTVYLKENGEYVPLRLNNASVHKSFVLAYPEGSDTFETAIAYKNKLIYCDRADVPKKDGSFFIADLLGLPILDADDGHQYGKLKAVIPNGTQDLYEVATASGSAYIPAVAQFIIKIELERGIFVRPIPGMFDEAEAVLPDQPEKQ